MGAGGIASDPAAGRVDPGHPWSEARPWSSEERSTLIHVHGGSPQPALHVVSQRLPVVWDRDLGSHRAPGGLVSALEPGLRGRRAVWFGDWSGPADPVPPRGAGYLLRPVRSTDREQRNAIEGYCNRSLWPALHGLFDNIEQLEDWWRGYVRRCDRLADLLASESAPGASVWLHDYHLFGVPERLRARRPDVRIALSIHTPVDAAGWRALSHADALRRRLAGCDVITVQTERDAEAVRELLDGVDDSHAPRVVAVPVGIDVARWEAFRRDPVVEALRRLHVRGAGCLAVGVDRLDYTKGVVPKLLALEVLFSSGRVHPDELRLVQIASPTRRHVPSYAFLAHDVAATVRRINTEFSRTDGAPVVELYQEQWPAREVAGLMRAADVALVTPVRDGMNLVAVEYAVVNADRANDLVLGAGAGVVEHLGAWSDVVDGRDVLGIADALHRLVRSPRGDRAEWAGARGRAAARMRSDRWARTCLAALEG